MAVTPERRNRRRGNVSSVIVFVALVIFSEAWWDSGWRSAALFAVTLVGVLVAFWLIEVYVEWPMRNTRIEPPPIEQWATVDTPPGARVFRGHPQFRSETHAEAVTRRVSGVADTRLKPEQPRSLRLQRRGSRSSPFRLERAPYETEFEDAMNVMIERRRGELETCADPAALITGVLVDAMGGDKPTSEMRDWFVNMVLTRVEADRYMRRLPSLDEARAQWKGGA